MLEEDRGITAEQYRRDIVWTTLALRKLAAERLVVSDEELAQAFDAEYGPRVKCRMIGIYKDAAKAKKAQQLAAENPQDFARLVRAYSDDTTSASANGWIQPIRKHVGDKELEDVAFSLKPGEVSPVIQLKEQYIILLCEGQVPGQNVKLAQVRPQLEEAIKDRKLRVEAAELFQTLQKNAQVVNVLNDPQKKRELPGVAATINGRTITIRQLSEECIARNGKDALRGMVNRRTIEQALRKRKLAVTQEAINAEIEDAASRLMPPKNGKPDLDGWIKRVTSEPGVTYDLYVRDAVWPSVAMKTLVKDSVKVVEQDLDDGYKANYGPRVRCAAIVMDDERQARKVWEMARDNPTLEQFGRLSAKYSTDASVKSLKGEIPPIRLHGGRPTLEQEAFALKEGELSGIIQTDGMYVILLCQGRTEPENIEMKEVRNLLYDHVYRQKLNDAMGREFDRLQRTTRITNYLEPKMSREPVAPREGAARQASRSAPAQGKEARLK
jgi:parvulin-like peptidyl-prolyl isomerase